uniref:Reverse transcriptase domain-containing protein n=1 Tax=Tanacetum cinerariifolium TaxID=118510 RepID=A0A6L2L6J0_TANCI|nr:reverse transcriptase domain-containing protein [Tanacetum cinerariifolium]
MPKPQSPLKESSQENPPTTLSNHDSLQPHSFPFGDSCDTNVGQAFIPPRSVNQTQLTQPSFPYLIINPHVFGVLHAQTPPSPHGDNQTQPLLRLSPSRVMLINDINQLQDLSNLLAMHLSRRSEPSSLFDFEEVMNNNQNQEPPPQNGPPPMVRPNGQAPRTMEELCQPSINGRGGPIAPIPIQATDFGLRRHMIQQLEMMNKNFSETMRQFQMIKAVDTKCETCGGPYSFTECPTVSGYTQETAYATTGTGSLPSNTVLNPREDLKVITTRSGVTLAGPSVSPSSSSKEVDREPETITNQVFTGSTNNVPPLVVQPSPASTSFSNNSSSKIPEVTKDMLSLPELTSTQMILELPDRSMTRPAGIAEDVFVKVEKFHFPTDFVVVDYIVDPRDPLILRRPFLRTGRALIDVYGEELTLRVDDEAITFKVGQTSKYSYNDAKLINRIDVIDIACEEYVQEVLGFSNNSKSGNPTPTSDPIIAFSSLSLTPFMRGDFILEEIEACLTSESIPPEIDDTDLDLEGGIQGTDKLPVIIEKDLKDDEKEALLKVLKSHKRAIAWKIFDIKGIDPRFCTHKILMEDVSNPQYKAKDSPWVSPIYCVPKKGGIIAVENENNELIPTRLEKTTFTCPYGAFAYRRMPFGLYNAPVTFQRCMMSIFYDMIEKLWKFSWMTFRYRGTHFCNEKFAKVMLKYGVTHRLSTVYHPQTSGLVEVSNQGLKRILEKTVGENRASWSEKLEDALWAFRTAYKTPIGCTPYKLKLQLNELCNQAYENSLIYKEKTNKLHDSKIKNHIFNVGDRVLLFNSRFKIFSGKLKTHWTGPFTIAHVFPYGTIELSQPDGPNFKVNGHRMKHYFGGDIPQLVVSDLQISPWTNEFGVVSG